MKDEEWVCEELKPKPSDLPTEETDATQAQSPYISIPPSVPHRRSLKTDSILDPLARDISPEEKKKQDTTDERKVK